MFPDPRPLCLFARFAAAAVRLPAASAQYDVEGDDRFWLRAVLDVRLVEGPAVLSWTDGGPGKIRYGGDARIELSQLALEFGASLRRGTCARGRRSTCRYDIAGDYTPWIVEANLRKEWDAASGGWGLQGGIMNLPFSWNIPALPGLLN